MEQLRTLQSPAEIDEYILEIESPGSMERECDTFVIPDTHGDPDALGNSLERAGLIIRNGDVWIPTELGLSPTTRIVLAGDLIGKGTDVIGLLRHIIALRRHGMCIDILAGNHEAAMLQGLMATPGSGGLQQWAMATGHTLRYEIDRHFGKVNKPPFAILQSLILEERGALHGVVSPDALDVTVQQDDILALHALPGNEWIDHYEDGGEVAMNTHFRSMLTREEIHRVARQKGDHASILWQYESTDTRMEDSATARLAEGGVRYIVRGHDQLSAPRVLEHGNGIRTVTIDTGISKQGLPGASGYAFFHAARNGGTYAVSGN